MVHCLRLVTFIKLVVLRGIIPSAKYLAALDVITGGRVFAGIGPGSQEREYAIVGLNYSERWPRFDEAARALRSFLHPGAAPFNGKYTPPTALPLNRAPSKSLPCRYGWGVGAAMQD